MQIWSFPTAAGRSLFLSSWWNK